MSIILAVACALSCVSLRTIVEFQHAIKHDLWPTAPPNQSVTTLQTNLKQSHREPAGCLTRDDDRLTAGPIQGWALAALPVLTVIVR